MINVGSENNPILDQMPWNNIPKQTEIHRYIIIIAYYLYTDSAQIINIVFSHYCKQNVPYLFLEFNYFMIGCVIVYRLPIRNNITTCFFFFIMHSLNNLAPNWIRNPYQIGSLRA